MPALSIELTPLKSSTNLLPLLQNFAHHTRQGRRLIAIHDAALAVHDDDIAMVSRFQTEFQLRLLVGIQRPPHQRRLLPSFANSFP